MQTQTTLSTLYMFWKQLIFNQISFFYLFILEYEEHLFLILSLYLAVMQNVELLECSYWIEIVWPNIETIAKSAPVSVRMK